MRDSIIVALDTDAHTALAVAHALRGHASWVKVGMTLYYAEGPDIVRRMRDLGYRVFVDLKLHDIPHQVKGAASQLARTGAEMFTVHALGGFEMMRAAVDGACEASEDCGLETPDVLAVTVLTSMDDSALGRIGVIQNVEREVSLLAELARGAGLQGVVCSPQEAAAMRSSMGAESLVVTPGVRAVGDDKGDQARVATARQALDAGASHVVVGRPITAASDPVAAFEQIAAGG